MSDINLIYIVNIFILIMLVVDLVTTNELRRELKELKNRLDELKHTKK